MIQFEIMQTKKIDILSLHMFKPVYNLMKYQLSVIQIGFWLYSIKFRNHFLNVTKPDLVYLCAEVQVPDEI